MTVPMISDVIIHVFFVATYSVVQFIWACHSLNYRRECRRG